MSDWIFWAATTVFTIMYGIIAYYFKKTATETNEAIQKLANKVDRLDDKLAETIARMPFEYTLREDFIRSMSGVEAKLDKIIDRLPARGE